MVHLSSWNVNGLRAVIRKGAFQSYVGRSQSDIFCLQETKARQGQAEIDLPDYQEFWNSASKPGYSGTAIFSRIEPIQVINDMPADLVDRHALHADRYGNLDDEGRVIAAEFDRFWLVTVYTPNAKDDLSRIPGRQAWDAAFLDYLKRLAITKPIVVCGDLNVAHMEIDLARPKANLGKKGFTQEERGGFQSYLDAGLIDTFRALYPDRRDAYTWWNQAAGARARNIGWRIDYFLASESLRPHIVEAEICPEVMGSDHCPVTLELRF